MSELKTWEKARKIAWDCLERTSKLVKEGTKILELAEFVENEIRKQNAKPAFPVNLGINEISAHFTPLPNDDLRLKSGDLLKIDVGVQIEGMIGDVAKTFSIGEKNELIEAAEKILEEVKKNIGIGSKIKEVGELVERTSKEFDCRVIRNLCGHFLKKYELHAKPSIPNYKNELEQEFKEGDVFAIEIFVTKGEGWVKESKNCMIYQYKEDKPLRNFDSKLILQLAKKEFEKLPFTDRWIKNISPLRLEFAIKELLEKEALKGYAVLVEVSNEKVAQAEDTIILK